MKGINGLIVAALLGVAGAVCNFVYIRNEAAGYEKVSFVAIRSSAQINPGVAFAEEDFEQVDIPRANLGGIEKVAVKWDDRWAAVGIFAVKSYQGGELLLHQDLLATPVVRIEDKLEEGEIDWAVPVDPRLFVSEHYNPEDEVYFFAPPTPLEGVPGRAGPTPVTPPKDAPSFAGPFRILAIGARTGTVEVQRAAGRRSSSSSREDVIVVPLKFDVKKFSDDSEKLRQMTETFKGQGLRVAKRSSQAVKAP